MFKRTILALSVVALSMTGIALAQENATLLMRSGETVSGQLVDMGGVGFTVNVNGQERRIPTGDVAVIDFTGNPKDIDWSKISADQIVVLRNGQTVDGQLYDVGGTRPLRITVRTSSGERDFSSNGDRPHHPGTTDERGCDDRRQRRARGGRRHRRAGHAVVDLDRALGPARRNAAIQHHRTGSAQQRFERRGHCLGFDVGPVQLRGRRCRGCSPGRSSAASATVSRLASAPRRQSRRRPPECCSWGSMTPA